jgi:hypothetical protein
MCSDPTNQPINQSTLLPSKTPHPLDSRRNQTYQQIESITTTNAIPVPEGKSDPLSLSVRAFETKANLNVPAVFLSTGTVFLPSYIYCPTTQSYQATKEPMELETRLGAELDCSCGLRLTSPAPITGWVRVVLCG